MSTKILVTSEIATWLVNSVNKTYTVANLIDSINLVTVNSIPYAQYSFNWTSVVLDDAPTAWLVNITYNYESNYDFLDNSGWIVGEVTNWVIDSTNKVFLVTYPISIIDEVRVNWIVVAWYSILGNSILLAAAPTTWYVEVDYFRKDTIIYEGDSSDYYTKKEIRDLVYDEIAQDDTSVQYQKSLVDTAIKDWVTELITEVSDKSRSISISFKTEGYISALPIDNSISTIEITSNSIIPPKWRLMSFVWSFSDYSSVSSSWIISLSTRWELSESGYYYVGYKLPRNIKRVLSVTSNWYFLQDAGEITSFLNSYTSYYINNWYIYTPMNGSILIDFEIDNYRFGDDEGYVYVDKEDVGVVVFYALRQLYTWRENDKLQNTSQLYLEKLKSYKRRMIKKRSNNKFNLMKTSNWLKP